MFGSYKNRDAKNQGRNQPWDRGGLPWPFLETKNMCPDLGKKNGLIMLIYRL